MRACVYIDHANDSVGPNIILPSQQAIAFWRANQSNCHVIASWVAGDCSCGVLKEQLSVYPVIQAKSLTLIRGIFQPTINQ